jgi:hypothetical protein
VGSNPTLPANLNIMNDVIINFFSLFKDFPQSKAIQSIKVKNKSFSFDRYGVEIDKKTITLNQVENILNRFLCALDKDEISDQYEKCSHICFALELDDKINYRIYFRRNYNFNSFDFSAESFIAYYSYKWDADNNLKILETNYEIFRNLDSNCILKKIKETKLFLPNFIEKLLKENDIIRNSHLSRKNNYLNNDFLYESLNNQCILSIICDSSSSRKSYNISHPAISVLKLSKEIEEIFNLEIKNIFAQFKDKKIDDITIGIDKHKENFMTFYFEDEKIIDYLKKFNII